MLVFVILLYKIVSVMAQQATTVKTVLVSTTTEIVTIITDIPEEDVEDAVNIDYGIYTTEVFGYVNKQNENIQYRHEKCYDDYTKCLIAQSVPQPVCVMNNPRERPDGFATYNSFCDAYFDNCQRKMRFWRILDVGKCAFGRENFFFIQETRKGFQGLSLLLKKLAKIAFKNTS